VVGILLDRVLDPLRESNSRTLASRVSILSGDFLRRQWALVNGSATESRLRSGRGSLETLEIGLYGIRDHLVVLLVQCHGFCTKPPREFLRQPG
jgi:hypothetical protein